MSMFNEKSAEISIDYGNYSDFIHFSSAEERLINFKYKLDLINSYETSISNINSDIVGSSGTTNNASYYENLIKGVVDNFDHYERFLYFESGSYAWPKLNNSVSKPYTNQVSSTPEAVSYFTNQRASASNFDLSNFNALVNTIPSFIREDENNAPYNLFVNMLGQHFDNLYIYSKAVSDKYNADNRLRVGVSRDLVEEAIKSLGVKLYKDSNPKTASIVPIAFPLIAGPGTLTTLISIKSEYNDINIILAIVLNMVLVYIVLKSSEKIQKILGSQGINILRKVFGIILLAIGIKLFTTNIKLIFA